MLARIRTSRELSKAMLISRKEANKIMDNMVAELKNTRTV